MDTANRKLSSQGLSNRNLAPRSSFLAPRGFTLVELLVVITIIGILASLITVAAVGALKTAQQTRIKVELNQISEGLEEYKNKTTAYPPNCQTDGAGSNNPIDEATVFIDLKRHLKQVAPKHREPDDLLRVLAGLNPSNTSKFPKRLEGGMAAGEAVVFWLGGFSSDPKYPISGEGGPSYPIPSMGQTNNRTLDPITNRQWVFPFEITRLGPRGPDDYFDENSTRYIEYTISINGANQTRRINFWQYVPAKSKEPFIYFDTSRHPAYDTTGAEPSRFDPPAATALTGLGPSGQGLHVHAIKKQSDSTAANAPHIQFVEPDKFQVLHCGIDDAWDVPSFERMSVHDVNTNIAADYLLYPTGPFGGEVGDTVVNFITQSKLEDAQPQ